MSDTVLLAMDFQHGIVDRLGEAAPPVVATAARAVGAARAAGIPVVFVRVAFRPGYPEVSPRNRAFSAYAGMGDAMTTGSPLTRIVPELAPRDDEPVVEKKRYSAFAGSGLDVLLRGLGAERLVLAGVSTSGVVLSTLRQAADLDFELTVLVDACADRDAEVHDVLMGKVFPRQADVVRTDDWIAAL
jgi:nicotinamidase-related amidase